MRGDLTGTGQCLSAGMGKTVLVAAVLLLSAEVLPVGPIKVYLLYRCMIEYYTLVLCHLLFHQAHPYTQQKQALENHYTYWLY